MTTSRGVGNENNSGGQATAELRDQIRDAIRRGEYAPRQRLIEADLRDRFGASRFLIRAALQDLAALGLVEFQHNRGALVREVSVTEAIECTEVRRLLEGLVAYKAAERATPEDAAELRALVKEIRTAVEAGLVTDANARLHARLRQIANHQISTQLLQQLRDLTARYGFTLSHLPGHERISLPQYEALVEAVANGDAVAAQEAASSHLSTVIDRLRELA